ncbi:MAG: hypothetical protein FK734_19430 [Asgard group archaeon]|nr:hypothetical protein [Asgard group archaeon]
MAMRKAFGLKPELMWSIGDQVSIHYAAVGNFKKGFEIIHMILQNDPLNLANQGNLIQYYNTVGDTKSAKEVYEGIRALVPPDNWFFNWAKTFTHLCSKDSVSRDKIPEIPMLDPIWAFVRDH